MAKLVTLKVTMTEEQWQEVPSTLESKIRLIERGDFGEGEGPTDNDEWVVCLGGALAAIEKAFKEKGIRW